MLTIDVYSISTFICSYRHSRIDSVDENILRAREGFRAIAKRAAVCFDCALYMKEVNPMYQMSFMQFLEFYDAAIVHSDR